MKTITSIQFEDGSSTQLTPSGIVLVELFVQRGDTLEVAVARVSGQEF